MGIQYSTVCIVLGYIILRDDVFTEISGDQRQEWPGNASSKMKLTHTLTFSVE